MQIAVCSTVLDASHYILFDLITHIYWQDPPQVFMLVFEILTVVVA
jgi:hypothetical protein